MKILNIDIILNSYLILKYIIQSLYFITLKDQKHLKNESSLIIQVSKNTSMVSYCFVLYGVQSYAEKCRIPVCGNMSYLVLSALNYNQFTKNRGGLTK